MQAPLTGRPESCLPPPSLLKNAVVPSLPLSRIRPVQPLAQDRNLRGKAFALFPGFPLVFGCLERDGFRELAEIREKKVSLR